MLTTKTWAAPGLIILATLLAYANGFTDIFAGLDAKESIRDNLHIRQLWPLSEAMSLDLLDTTLANDSGSKGGTLVRRPLLSLTFAINYAITGLRPAGFQLVNLAIHIAAALLLFGIIRRTLCRSAYDDASAATIALATGLLWAVHPVQTESVTNVVQRAESLMGLLYLLTLYGAIRGFETGSDRTRWWTVAFVACGLGMGVKETMVTAPVLVLLYDAVFVSGGFWRALRDHTRLYVALSGTWVVIVLLVLFTADDAARDFADGKTLPYLISQPRVIFHYLRIALWPDDLYIYVNTKQFAYVPGVSARSAYLMPAMAMVCVLFATAWSLARRRWYGFLAGAFFLLLAPTSSIVATSDVLQEHRLYLSLAPLLLAIVIALDAARRRLTASLPSVPWRGVAATLVAATALGLGARTQARNWDYHTEFATIHPADMRQALIIVARHEFAQDNIERATELFASSLSYLPDSNSLAEAHYDLGNLFFERQRIADAKHHFEQAIIANPAIAAAHNNLGVLLTLAGDFEAAAHHFTQATEYNPLHTIAFANLGVAQGEIGLVDDAVANLEAAIQIIPRFQAALQELQLLEIRRAAPEAWRNRHPLKYQLTEGYSDAYLLRDFEEPVGAEVAQ